MLVNRDTAAPSPMEASVNVARVVGKYLCTCTQSHTPCMVVPQQTTVCYVQPAQLGARWNGHRGRNGLASDAQEHGASSLCEGRATKLGATVSMNDAGKGRSR